MKNTIFFILFSISFISYAQEGPINTVKENGKHFKAVEFNVKKNTFYAQIIPQFTGSSLTIETNASNSFEGAYVLLGGVEKFNLAHDHEQSSNIQENTGRTTNQSSSLLIAKNEFPFFSFYSGNLEGKVRINLMYAAPLKSSYLKDKKKSPIDCNTKPESIDQSIWRVGLPDPAPNPQYSQVKHIILHHAAGSNTDTNYLNTVRSYYLLHTQTNGWNDIGYNYLVAPNGDIYDGRQGDLLGDDNVVGAHMCARNTNTMGICLLGNYEVSGVYPSDTAIGSINELVTWKLWKEQLLNPYDSSLHPVVNPVKYLGVIAGHRDGCAVGYTECPGTNYYEQIESRVKAVTAIRLANCIPNGIAIEDKPKILVYPNPWTDGVLTIIAPEPIVSVSMINSLGQVVYFKELSFRSYELGIEKTELGIKKTELGIMNEELGIIIQVKTVKGTFYQKIISN
jgi:hypothetical protein